MKDTTVCIAGPGSGKTRTLIKRVTDTINAGVSPAEIVCITFTNAAADEMAKRLPDGVSVGYCGTLHGFMLRALRRHGEAIGFGPEVQVINEDHSAALLDEIVTSQRYKGSKKAVEEALAKGPDVAKATIMKPADLVAATFFRTLKKANMVTFDTLLHYGAKVANQVTGYTHMFVDEAQDSSDVDFAIYRALPIATKFVVGDPDQSIYSFRGGNVGNLVGLAASVPPEKVILREMNYRCDMAITRAADRLIAHNLNRVPKQTVSATDEPGLAVFHQFEQAGLEMQAVGAELVGRQDLDECAILLRTNHAVSIWREYLPTRGVPVKSRRTLERPKDWRMAKALLAMFADPTNDMAAHWAAVLMVGQERALALKRNAIAGNSPLATLLHQSPWGATVESSTALLGPLVSRDSVDLIRSFRDKLPPGTICIQDLCLRISEADEESVEAGAGVTVCTIHAAKGREWAAVWLPGLDQATIPGTKKGADTEEERRLLYVAMTRAKRELRMSFAQHPISQWGNNQPVEASQFVAETGIIPACEQIPVDSRAYVL